MTCKRVQDKLSAYAAGELSPEERRTVEPHLRTCLHCRREAHAAARAEEALSLLAAVESAPDLARDLKARMAIPPRRWVRRALVPAAAAVLLALLGSLWLVRPQSVPVPTAPRPAVVVNVTPQNETAEPSAEAVAALAEGPKDDREPEVEPTADRRAVPQRPLAVAARPAPAQTVADSPTPSGVEEDEPAPPSPPEATDPTESPRADEVRTLLLRDAVRRRALAKSGVVFLVGRPAEKRQAKAYYIEITLPDGTHSVAEHGSVEGLTAKDALVPAVLQ